MLVKIYSNRFKIKEVIVKQIKALFLFLFDYNTEVISLAKAGMKRPSPKEPYSTESNTKNKIPKNDVEPVPEIQGKAKLSNVKIENTQKPAKHESNK